MSETTIIHAWTIINDANKICTWANDSGDLVAKTLCFFETKSKAEDALKAAAGNKRIVPATICFEVPKQDIASQERMMANEKSDSFITLCGRYYESMIDRDRHESQCEICIDVINERTYLEEDEEE